MSRKRMLDPGIWTDEGFLELEPLARLLFIGLISHADDAGRGVASARSLRARIFPGDGLDDGAIDKLKSQVQEHTRCTFYTVADTDYYQLDRWHDHQKMRQTSESSIPPCDETLPNHCSTDDETLRPRKEEKEEKEEKEVYIAAKRPYASNVHMTLEEHDKLEKLHGSDILALAIDIVDAYKGQTGKHYKSDYHAIRSWGIQAALERREKMRKNGTAPAKPRFPTWTCSKGHANQHTGSSCLTCGEDREPDFGDADESIQGAKT